MARLGILWLKTGPLHPLDSGGKLRTYHMLRRLNRSHEVTFVSLRPPDCPEEVCAAAAEYSSRQIWIPWREAAKRTPGFYAELAVNLFSALPYVIWKYRSREMQDRIRGLLATNRPDLVVSDFLTPAANLFLPGLPQIPTLLFQHNVESLIWERLQRNARGVTRFYFHQQWQRLRAFEQAACRQCTSVVGVSEADCALMRQEFHLDNVLGHVPTGVDTEYFAPSGLPRKPRSLVFLGSMDWMANIDGACWFVEWVLPLIRAEYPDVTLTIVGRKPGQRILELARQGPGIRVTGTVDDVRPLLAESEIMIVPLRIGGGTRIKIFEGMATGIPVVSTSIGAEGLPVTPEEHLLVGDSPGDFAQCVVRLFASRPLQARLGGTALRLVREQCSWERVAEVFAEYCHATCQHAQEHP